ncbi:MAG TPA: DUF642 domain-containing protein [Acetobacteraceae bacterium]
MPSFKTSLIALSAVVLLSSLALSAHATQYVTNGSFETTSLTAKGYFATNGVSNVTGWSGGGSLTFLDLPGTADDGSYLSVYGPFPATSPDGGKFVEADGDPSYRGAISQTINGLTPGQRYTLTFYQAAGQQSGFTGATTERWQVSFGNFTQPSAQFSLLERGVGLWQQQTMVFQATTASQVLSFLASGTPNGAPPISFLDGVSLTETVPEPVTLSLVGVGLAGTLAYRHRAKRSA